MNLIGRYNRLARGSMYQRYLAAGSDRCLPFFMALKPFNTRVHKHVQIPTDNILAMVYINHIGGANPTLSELAQVIWEEAYRNDI